MINCIGDSFSRNAANSLITLKALLVEFLETLIVVYFRIISKHLKKVSNILNRGQSVMALLIFPLKFIFFKPLFDILAVNPFSAWEHIVATMTNYLMCNEPYFRKHSITQ